mmetsp:Transcript_23308/g.65012  ORF Transcript_23308/g.65012 Transcript_23308/m.65012 type:complete len:226 (-) Transcript_23308:518-1195(-)
MAHIRNQMESWTPAATAITACFGDGGWEDAHVLTAGVFGYHVLATMDDGDREGGFGEASSTFGDVVMFHTHGHEGSKAGHAADHGLVNLLHCRIHFCLIAIKVRAVVVTAEVALPLSQGFIGFFRQAAKIEILLHEGIKFIKYRNSRRCPRTSIRVPIVAAFAFRIHIASLRDGHQLAADHLEYVAALRWILGRQLQYRGRDHERERCHMTWKFGCVHRGEEAAE